MRKKLSLLLSLFAFAVLLQLMDSCSGCCGDERFCLSVESSHLEVLDNSDSIAKTPINGTVRANTLLLRYTVSNNKSLCRTNNYFSLINNAYALSCPYADRTDTIEYLTISSNQDFNNQYSAGSELNELFHIPDYTHLDYQESDSIDILLLEPPADTSTHIFIINLLLKSGKVLTATSQQILIIP